MDDADSELEDFERECQSQVFATLAGVSHIVGQDVGLMVRGFVAALEDPQILVQRGILDLLTTTLKLNSTGFKRSVSLSSHYDRDTEAFGSTRREDQILLMRAVTGVVLRRDLSLSRRLYTWLLGSSESSESQIEHLEENGLELLREALKVSSHPSSLSRELVLITMYADGYGRAIGRNGGSTTTVQDLHFATGQMGDWCAVDRSARSGRLLCFAIVAATGRRSRRGESLCSALDDFELSFPLFSC